MRRPLLFLLTLVFSKIYCLAQSPELTRIKASIPHISDGLHYVDALNRMAMLLYETNIDSTFYYTMQARDIADRHDYEKGKTDALNNMGVVYDIKGNLQLALRYYDEAYTGYTQLHDPVNRVQTLMNMAMVYKETGKNRRAVKEFDAALVLGNKLGNDSIMSLAIYNYLLEYPGRFNRNSTDRYINKAQHIANKYRDERTVLAINQLLADNMIARGNNVQGINLLGKTIDTAINKKLYYITMDILIDMGDQLSLTDRGKAAAVYRQGLAIAEKNGYLFYSQLMARKLFDFYTADHDSLAAANYSRQLVGLHDEQEKLDRESGIDYLDYALKDQQVKSLELLSGYQRDLLLLVLLGCILAIVIVMVIRYNLKQARRQNDQMKTTLSALEQSQTDNTRMMQIVAHDLRNPVSGMYAVAAMMLDEPGRPESDRILLEMIKTAGQNSLDLVSDLLQVQFKAEELTKEPVDIGQMLRYCVSLLANKAEAKGQYINLQTQAFSLPASREKLWRVISNLIANAIKFSPSEQ
jgi:tetratricopeptide (TPR) repeat protein